MSTEPKRPAQPPTSPGAFGLAIASDADIPGLAAPSGATRSADHRLVGGETLGERVGEGRLTPIGHDGEGPHRVEYHEHSSPGVLIRTESYGDHLIADEGRSIFSSVADSEDGLWQRYVLGQVLPLSASIQGLEIFHASAVAVAGGVVALAGPSGAGKSSLAAALLACGAAAFFADDVLALDVTSNEPIAYPGPTLIAIPHEQAALATRLRSGPLWGVDERKSLAQVRGERRPLPVLAFLRLAPDARTAGVAFRPCPPDRLMATTFDGVSQAAVRPLRLLEVAAMLAADGRAQELRYRPGSDPQAVAAALLDRLGLARTANGNGG